LGTAASIASVAAGLAAALNAQTNLTRVQAYPVGDRIELQSLNLAAPGSNVTLTCSAAVGSAAQLTTLLTSARPAFLDTIATGFLGVLASNTPAVGDWLQLSFLKTNGIQAVVSATNNTSGATIGALVQSLLNQVNSALALQSSDGVVASDFNDSESPYPPEAQFALYARSAGWLAAQIQVTFTASTNLLALPVGTNRLEDNLSDLRPRNHLYVSSGTGSLLVNSVLDTTRLPDGFHELSLVAYEGTSVRTQTRVSRSVRFQNTPLAATFAALPASTNVTLDTPLQFTVSANAGSISRIELFSTGGSVAVVSNQQVAIFSVAPPTLGLGLHPFYALVTDTAGNRYRTQTAWIRIIPTITLRISTPPLMLSWPAMAGLQYDILATTNLSRAFQLVGSVTASNILGQWLVSAPGGTAAFYRVRLAQ